MSVKWVWLDCDGTWIDLYGVQDWKKKLNNKDSSPYRDAKPLVNLSAFAKTIHQLQAKNIKVGIITWLPKNSTKKYDNVVTKEKLKYLQKHLPSVVFDKIHILPYGTSKSLYGQGILFDDELNNRKDWGLLAFNEKHLLKNLKKIIKLFGQN